MQLLLYLFILGGVALAAIFDFRGVQNEQWYLLTVATLLAIGLYSSTFGISIREARKHLRLILHAITVGVLLKAIIIGSCMMIVLRSPVGLALGIAVAQIDPLATAALMTHKRLSRRAQTVLRAWSSFDDPVTVIMSLYAPVFIATLTGTPQKIIHGTAQEAGITGYLTEAGINILFAAGIFILWQLLKRRSKATNYFAVILVALGIYGLFVGALSIAVYYFWMLGVALLGLFMRPPIEKVINHALQWALSLSAVLLGILLINGVSIWKGIVLGLAAYGSQIIVGLLLTHKLSKKDRLHIAFAQQNGITAIILALLFESYYPGTVAIVGPAVVVINVTHSLANNMLDAWINKDLRILKPSHHAERLKSHLGKV